MFLSLLCCTIDVYCNGSSIFENTGPANIVCELNVTNYNVITVTFRTSIDNNVLAYINTEGSVSDLNDTDGISITLETNIITISLQNVTCSLVGFYGVELNVSSNVTDQAEGELKMISKSNIYNRKLCYISLKLSKYKKVIFECLI